LGVMTFVTFALDSHPSGKMAKFKRMN
jgi:hypothetical protein